MPRPVMLGIVGDSAAGKTTITRGLVRVLGEDQVTHFCTDDYHRYDRKQRAERNITPLDPDCNYLDILAQHLGHLRAGESIMKPVYQHADGTFGPPDYFDPGRVRGRRGAARLPHAELRDCFDVRVYLDAARGAAPPLEGAARLLAARLHDRPGALRARPPRARLGGVHPAAAAPRRHRRLVPAGRARAIQEHLDAKLTLRDSLPHPDLTGVHRQRRATGSSLAERGTGARSCTSRADIDPSAPRQIEEAIWEKMHFATPPAQASGSASSRSAPTCTARTRWRSSSC